MNEKEFNKLIDKKRYQVFLFKTPLSRPLSFVVHTYFVTSKKGKINRYEILYWKGKRKYLHINLMPPCKGFVKSYMGYLIDLNFKPPRNLERFESTLITELKGGKGSTAEKMIKFIEKNSLKYPFKSSYVPFPGPNSNTFIQWIIDKFPESGFKLPWNAFGKNYKIKS